jgi:aspartyl-tRNA(Asn)/glutamyl-tRNA(Gln) amidotransferase subunit A
MKDVIFTIDQAKTALAEGRVTSAEMVSRSIEAFQADKHAPLPLNAFLEMYDDAPGRAQAADAAITEARRNGQAALDALFAEKPLLGLPFAVKDNMSVRGKRLTCASKILEGYIAPYNATVIDRLLKAGAIPLGRCNMDEFAMGSSTEYSVYGPTRNPIDRAYVSGGSSGGGAAAVAANQALFALGTETGGSVRLPASYCGVYGLKTTYGVLSRWGIVAYGSSLDQVGVMGRAPRDIALPLNVMSGADFYDDTSADLPGAESLKDLRPLNAGELAALKVAVPKQFAEAKGLHPDVNDVFISVQEWLKSKGAKIVPVDLPVLNASLASYYVLALSEAASNLSRFDGIRYGCRIDPGEGFDELYVATRSAGFGPEVKRRIIIGNYVLSEQFSGDCYKKGMTVRARIQREIAELFKNFDIILCPTCPTAAFKLGQKVDDPLEMYLSDLYTMFVNLARIPSLSIPAGYTKGVAGQPKLPVGIQAAGAMFSELFILRLAQAWEDDHPGCGIPIKA